MRILIAPDKFKGSLDARSVAEALARGIRRVYPDSELVIRPLADGGEGTIDSFLLASGGRVVEQRVEGPLGEEVVASIGVVGRRAIVEMSSASGMGVAADRRPLEASSVGTGALIEHAAALPGIEEIVVGIGGSASTDGGTGAARAIGWRFLDAHGADLPPGGGALVSLEHIEAPASVESRPRIIGACDVDNPLIGARGAAAMFGPQKGAGPEEVELLERGLTRLANVLQREFGLDIARVPHVGAGGGMGAGLVAFFGGELVSGFDLLSRSTALEDEVARADLVVTGEGRLDRSSLGGKTPVALARLAAKHRKVCVAIAGDLALDKGDLRSHGIEHAIGLRQTGGEELAERDPATALMRAIEGLLRHRQDKKRGSSTRIRAR